MRQVQSNVFSTWLYSTCKMASNSSSTVSTRPSCSLWSSGWHNGSRATQVQTQLGSYTSTQLTQTQLPYKQACGTTNSSIYVWEDWTLTDTSAYKAFFHGRFRPDKVVLRILTWPDMGWHLDSVDSYFRAKVRVGGALLAQKGGKNVGCSHSLDGKHGKWHVHWQVRIPFGASLESLHRPAHPLLCQPSFVANSRSCQSVRSESFCWAGVKKWDNTKGNSGFDCPWIRAHSHFLVQPCLWLPVLANFCVLAKLKHSRFSLI